jgi:CubicO group peptidase (beta-lactamase class C family)
MSDEWGVISVDDHVIEPPDTWTSRVPEKFRDRAPKVVERGGDGFAWDFDGDQKFFSGMMCSIDRDPAENYQYFWWVDTPDDKNHFSARGNYGQYIYVAPEKDLVIVRLGKEEGERGYGYWIDLFEELSTKLEPSAKGSS